MWTPCRHERRKPPNLRRQLHLPSLLLCLTSTPLCRRQSRPHHLAYTGNEDSSAGGMQSFQSG